MLSFDKATYSLLLFKCIFLVRLSISLWGSDISLFFEFIDIVSTWYYICIECYTFLVISFSQYKEYMICLNLFSKFSDVLLEFTCESAIDNCWSIWLGGISLPFCCLLRSRITLTIPIILSGFSYLGFFFLLTPFLK